MRQTRPFRLLFHAVLVLLLSTPVILLLMALETSPKVSPASALSPSEIAQVESLLLDTAPETPGLESEHELRFNQQELDLLMRYALHFLELSPAWAGELDLAEDRLTALLSIAISESFWPTMLNVEAEFLLRNDRLELSTLVLGNLELPPSLLQFALERLTQKLSESAANTLEARELLANIDYIDIDPDSLTVGMHWDPDLVTRLSRESQRLFIPPSDQSRVMHYYRQISLLAAAMPAGLRAVSLNSFLKPLFASAQERSLAGNDPVAENRSLLQTLAIFVNNEDIDLLLGQELATELEPARFIEVRLHRRQDLAQHLVSAAALSASAGAGFALLLSNTKEAYDARYRSGFSFSDLAANSAGVLLASLATRNAASAKLMQDRITQISAESDYMPNIGNNRDGILEPEFNALYVNRSSPKYQARMQEIEQQIASRPLFQGLP